LTGGPVTVSNYQPTHRVGDGLREAIDWYVTDLSARL
jgi:hypothetical protein